MKPCLSFLVVLGMLAGPIGAGGTCNAFGTQLDCALGDRQLVIGTQTTGDPTHAGSTFRPQPFQGNDRLVDDRSASTPFRIELQDIGGDPSRCRNIGNERYCY